MFRSSLRSVTGPLRGHVCLSCLAQRSRGLTQSRKYNTPRLHATSLDEKDVDVSQSSSQDALVSDRDNKRNYRRPKPGLKNPQTRERSKTSKEPGKSTARSKKTKGKKAPEPQDGSTGMASTQPVIIDQLKASLRPDSSGSDEKETATKLTHLMSSMRNKSQGVFQSKQIQISALDVETPEVPQLSFGLERVLFNPGVYHLRDPRSRVFNFDPYLGSIMPVTEFDFNALKEYITSSRDDTLQALARKQRKKYVGSSSSMTSVLSHFHYLLSAWRGVDVRSMSQGFPDKLRTFTRLLRAPSAMFLRYQDGVYAIDADKEFDSANILMNLGKSMEKLLTLPKEEFERYRRSSDNKISAEEENAIPEAYHYSTIGDFVMRSQLDAYDPRLPGTGMFDLKTRAVVSIRMDTQNFEHGLGYEIKDRFGAFESYEREYFDMIRAAFLKYSLQVRIGRMDGIFVAFHNVQRIFGFQYVSLPEMDQALHGQTDTSLGDAEFRLSLKLWNKVLDKATAKFPKQSLRFHFETRDAQTPFMYIFAEPVTDDEIHAIQNKNKAEIDAYQQRILNLATEEVPEDREDAQASSTQDKETQQTVDTTFKPGTYDSEGPPDEDFLAELDKEEQEQSDRPLLAMTLTVRNKINGQLVERPTAFTESDSWLMEYELSELEDSKAQSLYNVCKTRREKALAGRGEDDSDVAANVYIRKLRDISKQGRLYREEENKMDERDGVVQLSDSTN